MMFGAVRLVRLGRHQRGATSVEYALIAGIVALGIISALISTKVKLNDLLSLVNVRIGAVQTAMGRDTRKAVSTTTSTQMLNNATLSVVTTIYSDGTREVSLFNTDFMKVNFSNKVESYGVDGKLQNALYVYPNGSFDNDAYTFRPDGSADIVNTNAAGDTFVYNAKTTIQDGYSVYAKHMISESRPLYQDQVQVSDISNPLNPVVIANAVRDSAGLISYSGSIDARKYLP